MGTRKRKIYNKYRLKDYIRNKKLECIIPKGYYCYKLIKRLEPPELGHQIEVCPFYSWESNSDLIGYCILEKTKYEVWDMCKTCSINLN